MNKYLEKISEIQKASSSSSDLMKPTYPSGLDNKGYVTPMSAHADIKTGKDVRPHVSYLRRALVGKLPGNRYIPRFK